MNFTSRQTAIEKAAAEYKKYREGMAGFFTPVERGYLKTIKQIQKKLKGKTRVNRNEL